MQPLPIDPSLPALVRDVREARGVVLVAEPGAGKTTREGDVLVFLPGASEIRRASEELAGPAASSASTWCRCTAICRPRRRTGSILCVDTDCASLWAHSASAHRAAWVAWRGSVSSGCAWAVLVLLIAGHAEAQEGPEDAYRAIVSAFERGDDEAYFAASKSRGPSIHMSSCVATEAACSSGSMAGSGS